MGESVVVEDKRIFDKEGNLKETDSTPEVTPEVEPEEELSFIQNALAKDVLGKFIDLGLIPQRYVVDPASNKIEMNEKLRLTDHEPPWDFVKNSPFRKCQWQMDTGTVFKFVPRMCRNCWKVVVVPRTLKELLMLKKLQEKMVKDNPYCLCKCGIEKRPDVERNYGGYFYNTTLEAGLLKLREVRELVAKHIDPEIRVILKRGCTEFERAFGDSAKWDEKFPADFWNDVDDKLESISAIKNDYVEQPQLIKDHVVAEWIRFAADRADPTVKELNHGKTLYPDYRTYEESDIEWEEEDGKETE